MGLGIKILAVFFLALSLPLGAKTTDALAWLDLLPSVAPKKNLNFAGLSFSMPESLGVCSVQQKRMVCPLKGGHEPCELIFEISPLNGARSLPLVRLLRKRAWVSLYGSISSYEEVPRDTSLGKLLQQRGVIYHLDNIQWPVLLRAFDVVIDEKTCISISTKCSRYDWPFLEKEVDQVLSSLKMSAKD